MLKKPAYRIVTSILLLGGLGVSTSSENDHFLVQVARLISGAVATLEENPPYKINPEATVQAAKLELERGLNLLGDAPANRGAAIKAAVDAATEAVEFAARAAKLAQEASGLFEMSKLQSSQASARASEVVTFMAVENARISALGNGMHWSSAGGTDKWLMEEVYLHRPTGKDKMYFVDIGANDGVSISQSLALEKYFNFTGLCIEASDPHFSALVLSRPHCTNVHACLSGRANETVSFAVDTNVLVGSDGRAFSGMYSGIVATNTGRREGWDASQAPVVQKETRLLADILVETNAPEFIEFLSIDCEGCELDVLSTFPFGSPWKIGALVFEHNNEEQRRRSLRSLLERHGFRRARANTPDDYYLLEDELRVPLVRSLHPPHSSPIHRHNILTLWPMANTKNSFGAFHGNGIYPEQSWRCPVDVSAVLERGAVSGACPLPSAHDGYQGYGGPSKIARSVSHHSNICRSYPLEWGQSDDFSSALGALGFNSNLALSVRSSMFEEIRESVCSSNRLLSHAFAVLPSYFTTLRVSQGSATKDDAQLADYMAIPASTPGIATGDPSSKTSSDSILPKTSLDAISSIMSSTCEYLGNVPERECDENARLLVDSLEDFRGALRGNIIPQELDVDHGSNEFIRGRNSHKLIRLQLYLDVCASNLVDPDADCTTAAWWLYFDPPLDHSKTHSVRPLEMVMERVHLSEPSPNTPVSEDDAASALGLLKRAAAAAFRAQS